MRRLSNGEGSAIPALVCKLAPLLLASGLLACGERAASSDVPEQSALGTANNPLTELTPQQADKANVRAAFVAHRQAEGASDKSYHLRAPKEFQGRSRPGTELMAANAEHGFWVELGASAVSLVSSEGAFDVTLETRGTRCADRLVPLSDAKPRLAGAPNRAELARTAGSASVTEWYANGPLGLEQGFVLDAPPCGGNEPELAIDVQVSGRKPVTASDGSGVLLARDGLAAPDLKIADLYAHDATGRALPTRFDVMDDHVVLRVGVATAAWPVMVDPVVATLEQKLLTGGPLHGSALDEFGRSVCVNGSGAIVGASGDQVGANGGQGSAYVFQQYPNGWQLEGWLLASDGAANDHFGYSVGIEGTNAVVGAYQDDTGANTDQGSAYVFVRSGTTWTQQQKLVAGDPAASDRFGNSVAISGTSVGVGAPYKTVGANAYQGAAYVFTRSGVTWSQQAKVTASDGAANDLFGGSVSLGPTTLLVGAEAGPSAGYINAGAAYVYERSGVTWSQQARLNAVANTTADRFGVSVSLSGNTAVVGDVFADPGGVTNQGTATVFLRTGTTWAVQQTINGAAQANAQFGYAVSVSADTAVIGAALYDGVYVDQGTAYVFVRSGTTWSAQATLGTPFVNGLSLTQALYGSAVSVSGDTALIGAYNMGYDSNYMGTASLFTRVSTKWDNGIILTADDNAKNAGAGVAISGNTALVGAPAENVGANTGQGVGYVFLRTGTTWANQARLLASDGAATDAFGASVALSGDTALVGAPSASVGANADQGAAYAFVRSGATWSQQQKLVASDGAASDGFGTSTALEGNNAVVGSPFSDPSGASSGSAYVFVRSGTTWSQQQKLVGTGEAAGDQVGFSVGLSGDTAIAGANLADVSGVTDQGAAFVFVRNGTTWSQQQKLVANDGLASDQFGDSVAVSGDTAVAGAVKGNGSIADTGAAYVFVRTGASWALQQKLLASTGGQPAFGDSVAASGNTIIVGATAASFTPTGAGYVFVRAGTVWSERAILQGTGTAFNTNDQIGASAGISGDSVILGAPADDFDSHTDHGSAYVYRVKGLAGQPCSQPTDCDVNYFCTDGVCCTSACPGPCEVCSAALGAITDGTCTTKPAGSTPDTACPGGVLCNGSSGSCPGGCTTDSACPAGQYCSAAGTCLSWKPNGQSCNLASDCASAGCHECSSNFCVDGVCCNTACAGGPCDQCNGAQAGTCATIPKDGAPQSSCNGYLCDGSNTTCPTTCSTSADCDAAYYCSGGSCLLKKAKGSDCTSVTECQAGLFCGDGVCCDTECKGKCEACKAANKESGADSGTCDAAKKGTNPNAACVVTADPCAEQASCSGIKGTCALAAFGASCGPTTCNGTAVSGKICDGTGTCIDQQNANCSPYVCQGGACTSPCTSSVQCVTDYYCTGGFCVAKLDNGKACNGADECKSSFCVDGVCCNAPCTGQCEACAETATLGQCVPVTGTPRSNRPDCSGTLACKGSCDGATTTGCALPGAAKQCQPAQCTGDVSQPAGTCDGAGACAVPSTKNCAPYGCDSATGVCKASCVSDTDCSQGSKCDTASGKCATASATCKDEYTVQLPNNQTQSCQPYKCVGGACQQQCSTSNDCAPGYACSGNACVASDAGNDSGVGGSGGTATGGTDAGGATTGGANTGGSGTGGKKAAAADQSGGCGCRVAGSRDTRWDLAGTFGLLAASILARRRRRSARSV